MLTIIIVGYLVLLLLAGGVGYYWGTRPESQLDWRTVYIPPDMGEAATERPGA